MFVVEEHSTQRVPSMLQLPLGLGSSFTRIFLENGDCIS